MLEDEADRTDRNAQEIADWLSTHLAAELNITETEIDRARPFADYGLDSYQVVKLTGMLAETLHRPIAPELAYDHPTIDLLAAFLALGSSAPRSADAAALPDSPTDAEPGVDQIIDWLIPYAAAELGLDKSAIDPARSFADYGLDSIRALRITAALSEWLGRSVTPKLAYDYPSIKLLAEFLAHNPAEPAAPVQPTVTESAARQTSVTDNVDEPIAIIGIGCKFPGADGPAEYWRLLTDGIDAISEVPPGRWNTEVGQHPDSGGTRWGGFLPRIDLFDAGFFNISRREAEHMDPQQRLLAEVGWEALEDAGLVAERLAGSRTGVFVGISASEWGNVEYSQPELFDAYSATGIALSVAANRLSYLFDFRGPSIAVDTACSSSLVAVHAATRSLRDRECDLALAGGVNLILTPALNVMFAKTGVMAPDGRCKTFDAHADGYVRGEGAGIVVLKPLGRALTDGDPIYAVIRGSAINQDGRTNGLIAPSRRSQESLLTDAYRRAGVSPGAVQYVEAHGTGTHLGDVIEAKALGAVMSAGRAPENRCLIGSHKTNIGHLEPAAGVAGLIKIALALHHQTIPPSLHYRNPNPDIPFEDLSLKVADTLTPWPRSGGRALAGVSSFGFGGTNAHVVMAAAPQIRNAYSVAEQPDGDVDLLVLSAKSPDALRELAGRYALAVSDANSVADLCYTAAVRRSHHDHRLAIAGASRAHLVAALEDAANGVERADAALGRHTPGQRSKVAFVFSGQGSQWFGMGQRLYMEEEVFRDALDACDQAIRVYLGQSILTDLFADRDWSNLDDIEIVQPAIFAIQVALAALWRSWGIEPDAIIGHSMGEVAAAHVAGALSLDDAAHVSCERAKLLKMASGRGTMLSAEVTSAEAEAYIGRHRIAVAATNSHRSTVFTGERAALTQLMEELQANGRFCRWVNVDVAAHGPHVHSLADDLEDSLEDLQPVRPRLALISTVTGDLTDEALHNGYYWAQNLRCEVRFSAGIQRLLDLGFDTFLEVSPHPILLASVGEDAEQLGRTCKLLPSMRRDNGARETLLAALGVLYTDGHAIAWEALHAQGGRCVSLPTYPWQRERFWLDTPAGQLTQAQRTGTRTGSRLLRTSAPPHTVYYEFDVSTEAFPELVDHKVHGAVVVPAASIVEFVLSAVAEAYGAENPTLRDVVFHRLLRLDDGRSHTLQVALDGTPATEIAFELRCQEPNQSVRDSWSLIASGALESDNGATGEAQYKPDDMAAQFTDTVPTRSLYRFLTECGLQYGPAFQQVTEIRRSMGEALARLKSPAAGGASRHAGAVPPQTLDGCLQVVAAALTDFDHSRAPTRDTYLPIGFNRLRTLRRPTGPLWCHVAVDSQGLASETLVGDVVLLDELGQVVLTVERLRLQRLPNDAWTGTPADPTGGLCEIVWNSADPSSDESVIRERGTEPGQWLLFSDGGAAAEALRTDWARNGQTCVTIDAGNDYVQLSPGEYRLDPAQRDDYRRLMADVTGPRRPPLRGVVHLWSLLTPAPDEASEQSLQSAGALGPVSVAYLVQALTAARGATSPRLWLVTQGAQVLPGDRGPVAFAQTPLWGMGRSINHEHPELSCSRIDLPMQPVQGDLRLLTEEVSAAGPEFDVALRGGRRYVARLTRGSGSDQAVRYGLSAIPFRPVPDSEAEFRMECTVPGMLDVTAVASLPRPPQPHEVQIRVHVAALNFIDAMRALGTYPGQADGPAGLGIECAGTVMAVGDAIEDIRVGDSVVAIATDAAGSVVTTPASLVVPKPVHLSFEQAAALPIAYLTARHSLEGLAHLRAGEKVLIHSAAGGVGLAAVGVARRLGATVFATAGTPEKRDYLRDLGIDHVFDSRSQDFADQVLSATNGEGVDVVLNSLAGAALTLSLTVLRPYGRFVEIGKRDIHGSGRLPLWHLRENASYMVVDLAQMIVDRPTVIGESLRQIVVDVDKGILPPLPVQVFSVAQTAEAVRCLARGKQIGKLAVELDADSIKDVGGIQTAIRFRDDATYLITGGLGGLGRAVALWMADRGARHLILMGRRPEGVAADEAIQALRQRGVDVVVVTADVNQRSQLTSALEVLPETLPPLRGVFHAAGILDDRLLVDLDERSLREVMAPKVAGAWNVHCVTQDADLDFFVLFSSAAAVLGSPGQAHYAAANAFLDGLAWHRRLRGRPATSIDWGPWSGIGMVDQAVQQQHLAQSGLEAMTPQDGLAALSYLLRIAPVQATVLLVNKDSPRVQSPAGVNMPLLDSLERERFNQAAAVEDSPVIRLAETVRHTAPADRQLLLETYLREQTARRLGLKSDDLDIEAPVARLGVDSLVALELRNQIQRDLDVLLPVVDLLDDRSVSALTTLLNDRISELQAGQTAATGGEDEIATEVKPEAAVPSAAESPWLEMLGQVGSASDDGLDDMLQEVLTARRKRGNV